MPKNNISLVSILKAIDEESATGASFSPGQGEQYATPFAFKKKKRKKKKLSEGEEMYNLSQSDPESYIKKYGEPISLDDAIRKSKEANKSLDDAIRNHKKEN